VTNLAPTAAFTVSCSGLRCTFDGGGSADRDGTIASYAWGFGDGTTGSGKTTSHDYPKAGSYTLTLTVTDDAGDSAIRSQRINPISLSARGFKQNGQQKAELSWNGPRQRASTSTATAQRSPPFKPPRTPTSLRLPHRSLSFSDPGTKPSSNAAGAAIKKCCDQQMGHQGTSRPSGAVRDGVPTTRSSLVQALMSFEAASSSSPVSCSSTSPSRLSSRTSSGMRRDS
jgi:PKD repeat protein